MPRLPYYDQVAEAARCWEETTDVSTEMKEVLRHGIRNMPTRRVVGLPEMPSIPQDARSVEFGEEELRKGLLPEYAFFRLMTEQDIERVREAGKLISSAFTIWQEKDGVEQPRFVVCLNRQSKFFERRPTRMEGAAEFCTHLRRMDRMISFDVKAGYRHLRLHADTLDDFVFFYNGIYYQCLAMPFGWGPASFWFTRFLSPVIKKIRSWGFLVLVYIDDVLVVPRVGTRASGRQECRRASKRIAGLLLRLGITKHTEKGHWGSGVQRAVHLGFVIVKARFGKRWVSARLLASFLGKNTSLHLPVPLARFYNRELYVSLNRNTSRVGGKLRAHLTSQAVRDLRWWAKLHAEGRHMHPPSSTITIHSDASDTG